MTTPLPELIDINIPRFNQAVVAALTGLAFVLQLEWLVAILVVVLVISRIGGQRTAPLTQLYVRALRPRIRHGPIVSEPAAPPQFAQLLGAVFLSMATIAFLLDHSSIGWGLALAVTTLAALAAATRICVGCLIFERITS